jgi:hypothetical protein
VILKRIREWQIKMFNHLNFTYYKYLNILTFNFLVQVSSEQHSSPFYLMIFTQQRLACTDFTSCKVMVVMVLSSINEQVFFRIVYPSFQK